VQSRATATRVGALEALRRVRAGEFADSALDSASADLEPRDRAWTQELVYGTLRLRGRLDHFLSHLVRGGLEQVEPDVLDVLRLGAYQLLEMGSVPQYAAISQSQELVRAAGAARAAGLVGGVLHALGRRKDSLRFPDREHDPVGYLSTWGSHPAWLVERWIGRWGAAAATRLVEANNRRPELYVRPIGINRDAAAHRLADLGVAAEHVAFSSSTLRVEPPAGAAQVLKMIPAVVQDPAAALVIEYAAVPTGARVVDLCAAPGGKALGMSEHASFVAAGDLSANRLRRLRENASRVDRADRVGVLAADGRVAPFRPASADMVLLDAPCTGTGTFRRHPDGRWRLAPAHIAQLTTLQAELLDAAAPLVRPGGWLVYSTCSLEPEENEAQVNRFLERHAGWRMDAVPDAVLPRLLDDAGRLVVLPQELGVDGAFAARMRKTT